MKLWAVTEPWWMALVFAETRERAVELVVEDRHDEPFITPEQFHVAEYIVPGGEGILTSFDTADGGR